MAQAQTEPQAPVTIMLRYADETRELAGVRLVQEIGLPAAELRFDYHETDRSWQLALPAVPVRRLEYRLELCHPDGRTEMICDPDNAHRAPGAFGDKSVLEMPGYRAPGWLDLPTAAGGWHELTVASRALGADLPARIWSPSAPAAGILLAHDGGEYDRMASLGQYCAAMIASGVMPAHHLVLLSPVQRHEWYSANPAYARALAEDMLPRLRAELSGGAPMVTLPVVALGPSLGALALLQAQRQHPSLFAGMFLQSGSFFQQRFDAQESNFPPFRRIVRFIGAVRRDRPPGTPIPTVLTCGSAEENLANNRDMATVLRGQSYPVRLVEVPDAHNFVAWRDAWHPHLAELATRTWRG